MRHVMVILVGALSIAGPAIAQDAKKEQEAPASRPATGLLDQTKALQGELQKAMEDFGKAFSAAKTDEEKRKLYESSYPDPAKWVPKFAELVKGHESEPEAVEALSFIIVNAEPEEGKPALDAILAHHKKSKDIGNAMVALGQRGGNIATKALKDVYAANPAKDVKGKCLYGLFTMAQAANAEKDVRAIAKMILKDYADVELMPDYKIGKMIEGELFKLDNLAVGKPAPDIEGKDFEGVAFKLSDYRGKVVMLDFWGFW